MDRALEDVISDRQVRPILQACRPPGLYNADLESPRVDAMVAVDLAVGNSGRVTIQERYGRSGLADKCFHGPGQTANVWATTGFYTSSLFLPPQSWPRPKIAVFALHTDTAFEFQHGCAIEILDKTLT